MKKEIDYKMIIAGKERIIPEIDFSPSLIDPNKFIISHAEFNKISYYVSQEILKSESMTLEELEFLREYTKSTSNEVIRGLPSYITVGYLKNKIHELNKTELNTIKTFFLNKINNLK